MKRPLFEWPMTMDRGTACLLLPLATLGMDEVYRMVMEIPLLAYFAGMGLLVLTGLTLAVWGSAAMALWENWRKG